MKNEAKALVLSALLVVMLSACNSSKIQEQPRDEFSTLMHSTPYQRILAQTLPPITLSNGYVLEPKAEYKLAARVLSVNNFWMGELAKIAPTDLALGWGKMSDLGYLRYTNVEISQGNRTYSWYLPSLDKANRVDIELNSANVHILPADNTVRNSLKALSKYDLVYIEGYLVDIRMPDSRINTSLSRADVGAGSCEVLYAQKIIKLR